MTNEEKEKIIEDVCDICKYPDLFLATYIDAEDRCLNKCVVNAR